MFLPSLLFIWWECLLFSLPFRQARRFLLGLSSSFKGAPLGLSNKLEKYPGPEERYVRTYIRGAEKREDADAGEDGELIEGEEGAAGMTGRCFQPLSLAGDRQRTKERGNNQRARRKKKKRKRPEIRERERSKRGGKEKKGRGIGRRNAIRARGE